MGEKARYTFAGGSRAEGMILYDDHPSGGALKAHSVHDTDPARGQQSAWDLVRLHKFGSLDAGVPADTPITELPSQKAMCKMAAELPEIQQAFAKENFEDLGPLTAEQLAEFKPLTADDVHAAAPTLARHISEVLSNPTKPRWLLRDELEWGVIAVVAGPRGTYKSFLAINWAMRVAVAGHAVYVVSAEGGDFDRRARAWLLYFAPEIRFEDLPLYVVERRLDLSGKEGIDTLREDCAKLRIKPKLFICDTLSKLSGALDENENTAVKAFIGRLDNGLKRAETAFDATVLVVAHTGHSDAGRPRGASALGADTDAEYIVSRSEGTQTVTVTRERFKASPELPPLTYKAEVVNLGYHDDQGNEVTSLVMLPTEADKHRSGDDKRPQGAQQQLVWKVLHDMGGSSEPVNAECLLTEVCNKLPTDDESAGRDNRRSKHRRALETLIGKGIAFLHAHNAVALFEVPVAKPEEWMQ